MYISPGSHLPRDSIAQLDLHTSTEENMYPQSLSIAQPVILRLHLREHDLSFFMIPQKQIWYAATTLLILLCHDFADGCKCLPTKTLHDLDEVIEFK